MQQCPNCGQNNRPGIIFCEKCGTSLIGNVPLSTKSLDASSDQEHVINGISVDEIKEGLAKNNTVFKKGTALRLEVAGSADPITLQPKADTLFGRRDPATGAMPDVDLTPFAGYRMGVSRRHAAIRHSTEETLELWDLGSSNGTFLNGQRLSAHRPYLLHDGDDIRLGQMTIKVYFSLIAKADTPIEPSGDTPASATESSKLPDVSPANASSKATASQPVSSIPENEVVPDATTPKHSETLKNAVKPAAPSDKPQTVPTSSVGQSMTEAASATNQSDKTNATAGQRSSAKDKISPDASNLKESPKASAPDSNNGTTSKEDGTVKEEQDITPQQDKDNKKEQD